MKSFSSSAIAAGWAVACADPVDLEEASVVGPAVAHNEEAVAMEAPLEVMPEKENVAAEKGVPRRDQVLAVAAPVVD